MKYFPKLSHSNIIFKWHSEEKKKLILIIFISTGTISFGNGNIRKLTN